MAIVVRGLLKNPKLEDANTIHTTCKRMQHRIKGIVIGMSEIFQSLIFFEGIFRPWWDHYINIMIIESGTHEYGVPRPNIVHSPVPRYLDKQFLI